MTAAELTAFLQTIPPDTKVVVYCWGGRHRDIPNLKGNGLIPIAAHDAESGTLHYREAPEGSTIAALADEIIQAIVL